MGIPSLSNTTGLAFFAEVYACWMGRNEVRSVREVAKHRKEAGRRLWAMQLTSRSEINVLWCLVMSVSQNVSAWWASLHPFPAGPGLLSCTDGLGQPPNFRLPRTLRRRPLSFYPPPPSPRQAGSCLGIKHPLTAVIHPCCLGIPCLKQSVVVGILLP